MSELRKLLDILNENTVAGSVATVSAPMGKMQERVEETKEDKPASPEVIEYGMWENSALTTSSKLKKSRGKSAKVVKSIYGEDAPAGEKSANKQDVSEARWTINARTGAKLHPKTGEVLPSKEKKLTAKQMFAPKKSDEPKLTLDMVWHKVENVCSQIAPDGDPIDWLAPWLEKHGIRDFKIGEVLDRAAKKNGYKDLYDYYDEVKSYADGQGVAEGSKNQLPVVLYRELPDDQISGRESFQVVKSQSPYWKVGETFSDDDMSMGSQQVRFVSVKQGVAEGTEELDESDLILNPASISKAVRGLVPHSSDRTDHEIEMAKSDLYQAGKNAVRVYELIKDMSEEEGLEGWVQEKITKAADYLNTIAEYLEGKQLESMDGVGPSTKMFTSEGEMEEGKTGPGLWANIHAKRERIKKGSGERMRKPGSKGAPTASNFKAAKAGSK